MSIDKELMLTNKPYNPLCKLLVNERARAKALCFEFNSAHPDQKGKKSEILSRLFPLKSKARIEANFYCDYGYNIFLGDNFFANHNCVFLDSAPITIGNNVLLGPGVQLSTSSHPLDSVQRSKNETLASPIVIGDNVWIGMGAQILAGVTIGANSIIAAGAVVTNNVTENTLVAGIPAQFKKYI